MNPEAKKRKSYISQLNKIFFLFTVILFWGNVGIPVRKFFLWLFNILRIENTDAALRSITSVNELPGILFLISLYTALVSIPVALFFALSKGHRSEDHAFYTKRPPFLGTIYAVGMSFGIIYSLSSILTSIADKLLGLFGIEPKSAELMLSTDFRLLPFYTVLLCILPALSEEFLTRGLLLRSLQGMGNTFAIILSSICFMLMHPTDSYIFSFISGLCIAYFSLRYKSIWVGIIIHFCTNMNATLLAMTYLLACEDPTNILYRIYIIAFATFMSFFAIWFAIKMIIRLHKNSFTFKKEITEYKKREILKCPFFYIFFILAVISAVLGTI